VMKLDAFEFDRKMSKMRSLKKLREKPEIRLIIQGCFSYSAYFYIVLLVRARCLAFSKF